MRRSLNLTETSPVQSFAEPVSLAEVKGRLRLSDTFFDDDDLLTSYIPAARNVAEFFQNRELSRKQWDQSQDGFWPLEAVPMDPRTAYNYGALSSAIRLGYPLVSVDLVQYRDSDGDLTALSEGPDYIVDTAKRPGLIAPAYGKSWPSFTPWPSSAVLIRYTSGIAADSAFWADSGSRVKVGMLNLIWWWYAGGLPFEVGRGVAIEYPFSVTALLSYGALPRVA